MPPKQKQEPQRSDEELIAIIAGAIAIGASAQASATTLLPLIGIPTSILLPVWRAAMSHPTKFGPPPTSEVPTAATESSRLESTYRAQYILAASRRVQAAVRAGTPQADALRDEQRFYNQHLEATVNRAKAAGQVDTMAKRYGDLVGWYAKMDARTSAECKAANGKNFNASVRPPIGYPGSVHPACRCKAGKPHGTRATVYNIKPEKRAA